MEENATAIITTPITQKAYQKMFQSEEQHWWFKSLRDVLGFFIAQINPTKVLDAGCGTGYNMFYLLKHGYAVEGVDISQDAITLCKEGRHLSNVSIGSITQLPYPNEHFDLIYSIDVLTNLDQKQREQALTELYRCTKNNGYIILQLAALPWLYSAHDIEWRIKKRFTKKEIKNELQKYGFIITKLTYRYFLLFPVIAVVRLLESKKPDTSQDAAGDFDKNSKFADLVLGKIMSVEDALVRYINLPIGSSLFVVAQKAYTPEPDQTA